MLVVELVHYRNDAAQIKQPKNVGICAAHEYLEGHAMEYPHELYIATVGPRIKAEKSFPGMPWDRERTHLDLAIEPRAASGCGIIKPEIRKHHLLGSADEPWSLSSPSLVVTRVGYPCCWAVLQQPRACNVFLKPFVLFEVEIP